MSDTSFNERKEAAQKAKQAMLEKFRSRQAPDPALAAARAEQARAREAKRAAAEEKRKARVEEEKLMRALEAKAAAEAAAAEAERQAVEAEREKVAAAERAEILAFEQKAARDLRYANRKARQGRK